VEHPLLGCSSDPGLFVLSPNKKMALTSWWLVSSRKMVDKSCHKGFDCPMLLVVWRLWKERCRFLIDLLTWCPTSLQTREVITSWCRMGIIVVVYFTSSHV
jgi:hypothetical protein